MLVDEDDFPVDGGMLIWSGSSWSIDEDDSSLISGATLSNAVAFSSAHP